ncbi:helix-turn-helix domain-containing protein [Shewanella vesiculosa]|mgnify:FL=1|uniref:helix-turn-helix domain-containing protein n=1 Tax=Shewanella vesiculosa TaxID=518738 RepID=UPI00384CADC9
MKKQLYSATNEAFVSWLKKEREKKGLSLRQVGELIGRHHSIIGNIETQVRRMDVAEFYEYCEQLNLDPHDCFNYIRSSKEKTNRR